MKRGFKSKAEQQAIAVRFNLGLSERDPLPGRMLAEDLGMTVVTLHTLEGVQPRDFSRLQHDTGAWSGGTFSTPEGRNIILLNNFHSPARQESTLMHEIAHHLCGHGAKPTASMSGYPIVLANYDSTDEEEAAYMGGCLQIPRKALLWAIGREMTNESIAEYFGASVQLARYRRNITGVDRQLRSHGRTRFAAR